MEKIDARTLSQDVQAALRRQVIRLRKAGRSNIDTAEIVGISVFHASKVWQRYKKDGLESIAQKTRGRRHGAQRDLTQEQEAEIKKLLIDKRPDQLKLDFALWTRDAVKLLILQRFDYEMPIRTVGEYLKRWGFTPQKPAKWAKEQSAPAVC
jgi:transposase